MAKTRVILELGSGNDLHGSDYTKAALRAVQDALHHSSLAFIHALKIDKKTLDVEVTIGVQRPERVDVEKVKASLPVGRVTVKVAKGGLDVPDPDNNDPAVPDWTYYNGLYSNAKFQNLWGTLHYLNQKGVSTGIVLSFMGRVPTWMGGSTIH